MFSVCNFIQSLYVEPKLGEDVEPKLGEAVCQYVICGYLRGWEEIIAGNFYFLFGVPPNVLQ